MLMLRKLLGLVLFKLAFYSALLAYNPVFETNTWMVSTGGLNGFMGNEFQIIQKDTFIGQDKSYIIQDYLTKTRLGVFKEDTSQYKVFIYENNKWRVYYDFSLEMNESITLMVFGKPERMMVTQVDMVDLYGVNRKIIRLKSVYQSYFEISWIEGIGSEQGIIYDDYTRICSIKILDCAYNGLTKIFCNCLLPSGYKTECPDVPVLVSYNKNCIGDTISFQLDLIRQPFSFKWDFGDPQTQSDSFINTSKAWHIYHSSDSFLLKLYFRDTIHSKDLAYSKWIHIYEGTNHFLPNDTSLCALDKITIQPTILNKNTSYLWFGDLLLPKYYYKQEMNKSGTYVCSQTVGSCPPTFDTINIYLISKNWIDLGVNKELCEGQSQALSVKSGFQSIKWSSGDTITPNITVNNTSTVWVSVVYEECELKDTVTIIFHPLPQKPKLKDTAFCEGMSILFEVDTLAGEKVSWWDNTDTITKKIQSTGMFWGELSNKYCSSRTNFEVKELKVPLVKLGSDTSVCTNSPFLIKTSTPFSKVWSNGDTASSISVIPPFTVWLRAENGQCSSSDTIKVSIKDDMKLTLSEEKVWCFWEAPLIVDLRECGYENYLFLNNGSWVDTVYESGIHSWQLSDDKGCKAIAQIQIKSDCQENVFIPNSFTPNNDGLNDYFKVSHPLLQGFKMSVKIYNRWGEVVFNSSDSEFGWDGTHKEKPCQDGNYLVTISLLSKSGKKSVYNNWVYLGR